MQQIFWNSVYIAEEFGIGGGKRSLLTWPDIQRYLSSFSDVSVLPSSPPSE